MVQPDCTLARAGPPRSRPTRPRSGPAAPRSRLTRPWSSPTRSWSRPTRPWRGCTCQGPAGLHRGRGHLHRGGVGPDLGAAGLLERLSVQFLGRRHPRPPKAIQGFKNVAGRSTSFPDPLLPNYRHSTASVAPVKTRRCGRRHEIARWDVDILDWGCGKPIWEYHLSMPLTPADRETLRRTAEEEVSDCPELLAWRCAATGKSTWIWWTEFFPG